MSRPFGLAPFPLINQRVFFQTLLLPKNLTSGIPVASSKESRVLFVCKSTGPRPANGEISKVFRLRGER